MKLTKYQIRAIERMTSNAQARAVSLCDVPMVWEVREGGRKSVWLIGSNNACEQRWFDQARFVMILVGPRGGAKAANSSSAFYAHL